MTEDGSMRAGQEAASANLRSNFLLSVVTGKTQHHQATPHFPDQH